MFPGNHLFRPARRVLCALSLLGLPAIAQATTVNPPDFPRLVNESDYVVRAVVKSLRSDMTVQSTGRKIYTFVELDVQEVIAGSPPSPLVLRVLGGSVGDEEMILQGAPKFQVGEEHILFVKGNGRMAFPLLGIMHGQYPIRRDAATNRKYVTRSNGVPLESISEVSRPMAHAEIAPQQWEARVPRALSPDQFIQQIKGVSKHPAHRVLH